MHELDTRYFINLDLVKPINNPAMQFHLSDVETDDFFVKISNNGTRVFDDKYLVTLYVVKPNGNFRTMDLTPNKFTKTYYCNIVGEFKNIPGNYTCQITVLNTETNELKTSCSKFKYVINTDVKTDMTGIIDQEEQKDILTDLINRVVALENSSGTGGSSTGSGDVTKDYVDSQILSLKSTLDTHTHSQYLTSIPSEYITESELLAEGFAYQSQLHEHDNKSVLDNITLEKVNKWDNASSFSGSYNDLTDKPTIPTTTSQLTNDSDFVNQTYVTNAIANAQLGGSDVDLSGYATKDDLNTKVDIVAGKGLSTNDLTNALKDMYDIAYNHSQEQHAPGTAEENVQSDWNETDTNSDAYIKNKPTNLATESYVTDAIANAQLSGGDVDLSDYAKTSDIPTKTSQLTNDSNYVTSTEMTNAINKVSTIVNQNGGGLLKIWYGTQAELDALTSQADDTIYIVKGTTSDTTVKCTNVSLSSTSMNFSSLDNIQTLTATLTPSNTTETITWSSNNTSVATVSTTASTLSALSTVSALSALSCTITPKANGSCIITATCGSVSATCNVTVSVSSDVSCTNISLNTNLLAFTSLDNTQTLTTTLTPSNTTDAVTWKSSNTSVATVSNGVVTPKGDGTCTITATCGSVSATCSVTVSVSSDVETDTYTRPAVSSSAKYVGSGQTYSTIQSAIDALGSNGGQIIVKGGTYSETLTFNKSGTSSNPIVIMNAEGETVTLDGGNTGSKSITMVDLNGQSNIQICGLEICNANCGSGSSRYAYGILGSGGESGIVIADCEIHDIKTTGSGDGKGEANAILLFGESTTAISDVLVYNNHVYNMTTNWSESISVAGNCENIRLINNTAHDLTNIAMDFYGNAGYCSTASLDQPRNCVMRGNIVYNASSSYASCAAYYADGARDCVIERNIAYNTSCGVEIGAEESSSNTVGNIIVRNNLIYSCTGYEPCTLKCGGYQSSSPSVTNVKFLNNTFVSTNSSVAMFAWGQSDNIVFANNIFYIGSSGGDFLAYADFAPSSITFANNIYYFKGKSSSNFSMSLDDSTYYTWTQWKANYDTNGQYLTTSPFTNVSNNDYTLADSSAAIDAGTSTYLSDTGDYDVKGNTRVNGTIDIGCYEHQ